MENTFQLRLTKQQKRQLLSISTTISKNYDTSVTSETFTFVCIVLNDEMPRFTSPDIIGFVLKMATCILFFTFQKQVTVSVTN